MIEVVEGDWVWVYVINCLLVFIMVYWYGVILFLGMDGVGGFN